MSAKIMGQVFDLDLPANEKIVLLAMAEYANRNSGRIHPSNKVLALMCGLSPQSVSRIKRGLEAKRLLTLALDVPGYTKAYKMNLSAWKKTMGVL